MAVAAMLFPAIFHLHLSHAATHTSSSTSTTCRSALASSCCSSTRLGLLFTLRTHAHLFSRARARAKSRRWAFAGMHGAWSVKKSVIMLLLASVGNRRWSRSCSSARPRQMAHNLGWNQIFVGVILLAIIGNAAEHSTARRVTAGRCTLGRSGEDAACGGSCGVVRAFATSRVPPAADRGAALASTPTPEPIG